MTVLHILFWFYHDQQRITRVKPCVTFSACIHPVYFCWIRTARNTDLWLTTVILFIFYVDRNTDHVRIRDNITSLSTLQMSTLQTHFWCSVLVSCMLLYLLSVYIDFISSYLVYSFGDYLIDILEDFFIKVKTLFKKFTTNKKQVITT